MIVADIYKAFDEVGFALSVVTMDDIDARARLQLGRLDVPPITN